MYLIRDDYATTVAYITGCDQGNAGTLLTGFREWLVPQAGGGDKYVWWSLVLKIARPDSHDNPASLPPDADLVAKQTLFRLLDEFLELRQSPDSLQKIFAAHQQWRVTRSENGCEASGKPGCPQVPWPQAGAQEPSVG
jgi:hypothetical protein